MIITVGCIIEKEEKILLVQEGKEHARGLWNIPSGRLESNEGILNAVTREVLEETGYIISIKGITGLYNFISETNTQVILINFIGEIIDGLLRIDNNEIIDAKWMTQNDIMELKNEDIRNSDVIRKIIRDFNNKTMIPLDMINDLIF